MSLLKISLIQLLVVSTLGAELEYTITKLWNGTDITWDPARITLSVTPTGDLAIEVSAPFFNTPIPPKGLNVISDQCMDRSHRYLWKYEVNTILERKTLST